MVSDRLIDLDFYGAFVSPFRGSTFLSMTRFRRGACDEPSMWTMLAISAHHPEISRMVGGACYLKEPVLLLLGFYVSHG